MDEITVYFTAILMAILLFMTIVIYGILFHKMDKDLSDDEEETRWIDDYKKRHKDD